MASLDLTKLSTGYRNYLSLASKPFSYNRNLTLTSPAYSTPQRRYGIEYYERYLFIVFVIGREWLCFRGKMFVFEKVYSVRGRIRQ